ncbi:MAG: hypothetical protein ACOYYJ_07705 [Chloroflexota bacterium]
MKKNLFLSLITLALALAACAPQAAPSPEAAAAGKFDVNKIVGVYEGAWTNQSTGATGPAVITIVADEPTKTATLTLDFGGNYLGLNDPPPATITTKYDDSGAHLSGTNVLFGAMDVTIDANGNIVGTFENLAGGMIPGMTYTGKIGDGRLDAEYIVTLSDGKTTTAVLETVKK